VRSRHRFFVAMVLFPALLLAQTAAIAPKTPAPAPTAAGNYPVMSAAAKARARQIYGYFENGQSAQLYAAFSAAMKKNGSPAKAAGWTKEMDAKLGKEQKVLGENFVPDVISKGTVYSRFVQFAKSKDPVFAALIVDEQGMLTAMQFRPSPPAPANKYDDYKVKTKLALPFNDEWIVYQGGREIYQNPDAYRDAERYSIVVFRRWHQE
jgi:hypothetical protein